MPSEYDAGPNVYISLPIQSWKGTDDMTVIGEPIDQVQSMDVKDALKHPCRTMKMRRGYMMSL